MNFRKLITYLTMGTAAAMPIATAQNPTILQGNYITNVFGNSNFVLNPNAQTNVANVTNATRSTSTPLVATSEFTLNLTNGSFATWTLRAFDGGMKGQNCEARFTYRGFATATTKAEIVQNSLVVATLTLTPTTDPRIASINFPCGDLVNATTFRIAQTTANMTTVTPNEIGGIYVGLATNMANVAQAETVVLASATTGSAQTIPTASVTKVDYASKSLDVYNEYNTSTSTFTAKRAGTYQVSAGLLFNQNSWSANNEIEIYVRKNSTNICSNSRRIEAAVTSWQWNNVICNFQAIAGDTVDIAIYQNSGGNRDLYGSPTNSRFQISRFPSSSELVVTPERQNVFGGVRGYSASTTNSVTATSWTKLTASSTLTREVFGKADSTASNDLSITIKNLPVGTYEIKTSGAFQAISSGSGDATFCSFGVSDLTSPTNALGSMQITATGDPTTTALTSAGGAFIGIYNNTSVADRTFTLFARRVAGVGSCNLYSSQAERPWTITVTPLDQPSNSALYVQGPVLASQTGAAIPSGYVFEELTGTNSADFSYVASTTANAASITLQPGIYLLVGQVRLTMNTGSDYSTDNLISISDTSATYDADAAIREISPAAGGSNRWQRIQRIVRVTTANKVWYLTSVYFTGGGTVRHVNNSNTSLKAYRLN